ncbi:helix-turn-helix domain-containing protein [Spirosoma aerophilum]
MTLYAETLRRLHRDVYPRAHLTRQIIAAKQFMDRQYADALDLDLMAREAAYSRFHFIRCFKALYGRTPMQYLISIRIEKAKQLLLTDEPVADVCCRVGFESVTTFIGLFKKITGMTPTAYRRKKQFSRSKTES